LTITCRKIGKTPLDFSFEAVQESEKGAKIEGSLVYKGDSLIELSAKLSGNILQECDICCEMFQRPLDEELDLLISDGVYTTNTHVVEDIIEVEGGVIQIDEILHSEIELIRSDYFTCEKCTNEDLELEY